MNALHHRVPADREAGFGNSGACDSADGAIAAAFPRAAKYSRTWAVEHSLGENVLYNLESLCEKMVFQPGMRVLDLGCGLAISSIFLAKEFGVRVWALDKGVDPDESYALIREQKCEDSVFPLCLGSRPLPFPREYFDAIVSVNSFHYFGTDERFLPYLMQFLKPNGSIGITDMCFRTEITSIAEVPSYLKAHYQDYWYFLHTVEWWKDQWARTGLVNIQCAEELPATDLIWKLFIREFGTDSEEGEVAATIERDRGELIRLFRLVGQRSSKKIYLQEPEK